MVPATGTFATFDVTVCGIDELSGHCQAGVSHVLSILDPGYPELAVFGAYGEHARLELRFYDVIEEHIGLAAPQEADVERLLAFGRALLPGHRRRPHLLVHCHAGVSRSTAATALLLAQADPDRPAAAIIAEVVRLRPIAWPNLRIIELGDRCLRRGGALVAATRARYAAVVARDPDTARVMIAGGRGREVPGGVRG
jgi:predicted protein tyrosine phosphatase